MGGRGRPGRETGGGYCSVWFLLIVLMPLIVTLSACDTQTHIAKPSDAYLTCADEPLAPPVDPILGKVTDEQDALYKSDLRAAWADCSSKVQYLHDWFRKLP